MIIKIKTILISVFLLFSIIIWTTGYISANAAQERLEDFIGERGIVIATRMADRIEEALNVRITDMKFHARTELVQEILTESNQEFEKRGDIQAYIDEQDKTWIATKEITPFIQDILKNELSRELKSLVDFYKTEKGYPVFAELIVANNYGAIAAISEKTTDYRQDDEEWWQIAKSKGTYLRDVSYDESADVYATDFSVRIDDKDANFIGVMKVVLNFQEIIDVINSVKAAESRKGIELKLIDRDGKILYSTEGEKFLSPYKEFVLLKGDSGKIEPPAEPGKRGKIIAYLFSKGKKQIRDLGWAYIIVEVKSEETFGPLASLQQSILSIAAVFAVLSIVFGLFISGFISKPLNQLQKEVDEISKGNFKIEIAKTNGIYEVNSLAESLGRIVKTMKLAIAERGVIKMKESGEEKAAKKFVEMITKRRR